MERFLYKNFSPLVPFYARSVFCSVYSTRTTKAMFHKKVFFLECVENGDAMESAQYLIIANVLITVVVDKAI